MAKIQPADALLVIDVGNSRVGVAVWDEDGLHDVHQVATGAADQWTHAVQAAWLASSAARRREVVIASVAPQRTPEMVRCVETVCGVDALLVRDDLPLPLPLDVDNPESVGVDRVCAAAAAYDHTKAACAVASFGTAATIDCVSAEGQFLGGVILPGFDLSLGALHDGTSQLPRTAFAAPISPFGKSTEEAMRAGVAYGMVGALREVVERFATALNEWPRLVITGGNAPVVAELADFVDAVVPHLCLMGVALAHRRAAGD